MHEFKTKPTSRTRLLESLHPSVREWFFTQFKDFSQSQLFATYDIHCRKNILLSAPTGSTKTLTSFLSILNELIDLDKKNILEDRVYAIYISPLKALNYDIEHNLQTPLEQIDPNSNIRVGVRTGDTTPYQRSKMQKTPPHILITTPESLALLLSTKFTQHITKTDWLIIDEIHALATNKRGVYLSLLCELLQELSPGMARIGLSATIQPLETIASFLVGKDRDCTIIDIEQTKSLEVSCQRPVPSFVIPHTQYETAFFETIHKHIQEHTTTLIFTNTRFLTEKIVFELKSRFEGAYYEIEEQPPFARSQLIATHHGSLNTQMRKVIESKLRSGKLKCVVCSTSLELGIDIGYVDFVIQVGSPKSVSKFLQRIGRSGHKYEQTPKGIILAQDRDDYVESALICAHAKAKNIDSITIPTNCLDVLSQFILLQIIIKPQSIKELHSVITQSYCYKDTSLGTVRNCVQALGQIYEQLHIYPRLFIEDDIVYPRKTTKLLFQTNVGTIADSGRITVKIGTQVIGFIDEGYLEELRPGDTFVLGGETYAFSHAKGMVAFVRATSSRKVSIPRWFSRALALSQELSHAIANTFSSSDDSFIKLYANQQKEFGFIPQTSAVHIEQYSDGPMHFVIIHSPHGRRINEVLALALFDILSKTHHATITTICTDKAILFSCEKTIQIQRAMGILLEHPLDQILTQSIEQSEHFKRRIRQCAYRGLFLTKRYKAQTISVNKQQVKSHMFYYTLKRLEPDHPIILEARREITRDVYDYEGAKTLLEKVKQKTVGIFYHQLTVPSPCATHIAVLGYSDYMSATNRQEYMNNMYNMQLATIALKNKKQKKAYVYETPQPINYYKEWGEDSKKKSRYTLPKIPLDPHIEFYLKRVLDGTLDGTDARFKKWLDILLEEKAPKQWDEQTIAYLRSVQKKL
ncbi:MAG: DEAD/DEAH box helicase [Candidatus Woesearchaeota archaeon]